MKERKTRKPVELFTESPFIVDSFTTSNTYILKSNEYYKIGKADNVEQRFKQIKTGNPTIELIKTIEGNYESFLHKHFKSKLHTGEWYLLTKEDVLSIDSLISNTQPKYNDNVNYISINVDYIDDYINILTLTEWKLWFYILKQLKLKENTVTIDIDECCTYMEWKGSNNYYLGIRGLIEKNMLVKSVKGNTTYWINTNMFFNGDRLKIN